jgi:hypothetical protein
VRLETSGLGGLSGPLRTLDRDEPASLRGHWA